MMPFTYRKGSNTPLGVKKTKEGINFALFSKHATNVTLCLFQIKGDKPFMEIPLTRSGDIWHVEVTDLTLPFEYTYRCDGPYQVEKGHLFNKEMDLVDPYAPALNSSSRWGDSPSRQRALFPKPSFFDWENDARPMIPMEDLIIYEMHVRGFTQDPSSGVKCPGSFLGIMEKIPYLKKLGINAIELMPIYEFHETDNLKRNPKTHQALCNYWGYSSAHFFVPMNRYGTSPAQTQNELKELVKALHREGIEIILDVVYNHTVEGSYINYYHSFRGIDNATYYMVDENGYRNYSGCGNTLNCNNPAVTNLIIDSLRHFVLEYHIDGFRFDLASIFTRGEKGEPLEKAPLIEKITRDPILGATKLIAEPWDVGGLYLVGKFPSWKFSEWNGKYRDDMRRFIKGNGNKREFASSLMGSENLYKANKKKPYHSINFITSHDGFTLHDLVSYNQKHNEENGENNQDGIDQNESWNCGVEGPTDNSTILNVRNRQMRNFLVALFCSQGVPMIFMGDECQHSKKGNNNTWCQDNALNYLLWDHSYQEHFLFVSQLIAFRKTHPILRSSHFLTEDDISWQGITGKPIDWDVSDSFLSFILKDYEKGKNLYIAFNSSSEERAITLPKGKWQCLIDTRYPIFQSLACSDSYSMLPFSSLLLKLE